MLICVTKSPPVSVPIYYLILAVYYNYLVDRGSSRGILIEKIF